MSSCLLQQNLPSIRRACGHTSSAMHKHERIVRAGSCTQYGELTDLTNGEAWRRGYIAQAQEMLLRECYTID
jgi:hypothetical protein